MTDQVPFLGLSKFDLSQIIEKTSSGGASTASRACDQRINWRVATSLRFGIRPQAQRHLYNDPQAPTNLSDFNFAIAPRFGSETVVRSQRVSRTSEIKPSESELQVPLGGRVIVAALCLARKSNDTSGDRSVDS